MKFRIAALLPVCLLFPGVLSADTYVSVIQGLGGSPQYEEEFSGQTSAITTASLSLTTPDNVTVLAGSDASREGISKHLAALGEQLTTQDRFILYLVGHGSFDGYQYKFNVPGPDLTGEDLAGLLVEIPADKFFVNTSSASGAMRELLEPGTVTFALATRSGFERHATRFGEYFANGLLDPTADVDKNNRITSPEAFRFAQKAVGDYYKRENRLATEHAVIETRGSAGLILSRLDTTSASIVAPTGPLARRKQQLNNDIEGLRRDKASYPEEEYQSLLLEKLIELAELEEQIETESAGND